METSFITDYMTHYQQLPSWDAGFKRLPANYAGIRQLLKAYSFELKLFISFLNLFSLNLNSRAALSYSARKYNSAICCSKISRDSFLGEALYEADKALEKFSWKVCCSTRECVCLQDGRRSRQWIANVCFILLCCIIWVSTASIFVYVCFVDCLIDVNR